MTNFIDCYKHYGDIYNINDKYSMRKFIQKLETKYNNHGLEYAKLMIEYFCIIEDNNNLLDLFKENSDVIVNLNQVKITGHILMSMGYIEQEIKEIKTKLFQLITEDKLENNEKIIIQYLNNI